MCFVVLLLCVKELFCINQLDMKNYHHSKYYCFFICMYCKYTIVCSVFFVFFVFKKDVYITFCEFLVMITILL